MINKDELLYKLNVVINYLKTHDGFQYKVYNNVCPDHGVEPDSNIVEYAEDVEKIVLEMLKKNK